MSSEQEAVLRSFLVDRRSPVVDGERCTFITEVEADAVFVRHRVIEWPTELPLSRVTGTDLWLGSITLPAAARVEYQLERRRGADWQRYNDPGNPRIARSPVGDSSVAWGAAYATPAWALPDPAVPAGELLELAVSSRAQQRQNRITLYRPAGFSPEQTYPLLIVHDGGDFLAYAAMKTVLDNLIAGGAIADIVVAFSYPGERLTEYPDDEAHARWITTELPAAVADHCRVGGRSLMGSSFGAVAALSTAARYPVTYEGLLLQSGSFVFTEGDEPHGEDASFDPVVRFVNAYRAEPERVCHRLFLSCGVFEDLIVHDRAMVPVFRRAGMDVRYVESFDGHNWESWRDRLRDGLTWLFPGRALPTDG